MKEKVLFILLMLTPLSIIAVGVEKDGLIYNLNYDTKEASVTSALVNYSSDIVIPNIIDVNGQIFKVTSIEDKAFYNCVNLISVAISSNIVTIGISAFQNCNELTSITVDNGNLVYDSRYNCNAIIETETNTLLIGCKASTIPYSVQAIGARAFQNCIDLKTVSIPSTVTYIGGSAFAYSGLVSINIPNSVKYIMSDAFSGCKCLTSISLPNSISSIDQNLFQYCSSLTSVEIPNSVKSIDSYAFSGCNQLESLEIPNSVTSIGEWAFENCDALRTIKITKGVEELKNNVFYFCDNLQFVYLPSSLKTVGSAFDGCWLMSDVYCFAEDVPIADTRAFRLPVIDNNSTLHVPANSIENYKKASVWNNFGNIVALTDEELKMYDDDNYEGIVNPEPDKVVEGVYQTQPESYRINKGNSVAYGKSYEILITPNSDGTYRVDDLFGGWYSRRAGYGPNYAMTGDIIIAVDGTVSLKDSYVAGWGDSLVDLTGNYDASTSTFTIEAEYLNGLKFIQTWKKDNPINIDGINYRIGENYTVSVAKGNYSGDITIPKEVSYGGITYSVTSLDDAFRWCSDVTSVKIPQSVTSLWDYAFEGCSGLTSVEIPNSVTSLGKNTFSGCKGLSSLTIPINVTSIDNSVFMECSGLISVAIPNSVTSIGYMAFHSCHSLSNLTLSENLTTIWSSSFVACNGLKSLIIPASVLKIGNRSFTECEGLESIFVESENIKYDSRNDCNAIIETYTNKLILGCKNTVIPQDVTIIGDGAFAGCVDLKMLDIPNSVTTVENEAFWRSGIRDFITGSNVERIDRGAFYECSGLHSIVISSTIKQIGWRSFSECPEMKNFYLYANISPSTDLEAFSGTPIANATLHVPAASLEAYKRTAPWSGFGKIVALTDNDPKPTGINTQKVDNNVYPINTYTIEGRHITNPQQGLNIIRMKDGTIKKVIVKK